MLTELIPNNLRTIRDVIRLGITLMNQNNCYFGHGTDNALDESVSLILGALDLPFDIDPLYLSTNLTETEIKRLNHLLNKRIFDKIPVAYLLEKAWFMGLPFYVTQDVLIPRSPIAEEISRWFTPWVKNVDEVTSILDLCTGSGCIGIACAYSFPNASVVLSDISEKALAVANQNIKNHHLEHYVTAVQSDLFDQLSEKIGNQRFDIIVSNPPYVPDEEMITLPDEYRHEPTLGLRADDYGLALVKRILKSASDFLTDNGILVVEVGNTELAMEESFSALPLTWIAFNNGGAGVFMIDAFNLKKFKDQFN